MGFFINDKNNKTKKGAKPGKNATGGKTATKTSKPTGGGGKKLLKTGGTRGS